MPRVTLVVAESLDHEDAFALDPMFADGKSHATMQWIEARVFPSEEAAHEWCENNPSPPFKAVALIFEIAYFH